MNENQEREAFEAWFEQERTRTWFAAGCDKDRGPIPSEFWAMGIKADWWTGWQARSALAATPASADPVCTCPSGDGSLRWPCPAHPPEATPAQAQKAAPEGWETANAVGDLMLRLDQWKATNPRTAPPAWAALVEACRAMVAASDAEKATPAQAQQAEPTEPGWYVVLPPDFDKPTVRAFGKDRQWWIPLGRGNGADGWMTGRPYKNWAGPIAPIDDPQPFLAEPPKAAQPLTDAQIIQGKLNSDPDNNDDSYWSFLDGVRFAERKHGIGGEGNHGT